MSAPKSDLQVALSVSKPLLLGHYSAVFPIYFWCPLQCASLCLIDPNSFCKFLFASSSPIPRFSPMGMGYSPPLSYRGRLTILLCCAWKYVGTERRGIRLLNSCLNMLSNRLARSLVDGTRFYNRRRKICSWPLHLKWNPREKRPAEQHDHFAVNWCFKRQMARAGQCSYSYPDISTAANAIACLLLEDLKVYRFILWMDNFCGRRFCPTPHSPDKMLNTTVFAVCLVPIRLDPFPGYCSQSSIVDGIDTIASALFASQQEHHTPIVNTYNAIATVNKVECPLDICRRY